jgi:predicted protein tyrosine phosphatase
LDTTILTKDKAIAFKPKKNTALIRLVEPREDDYELSGSYAKELVIKVDDIVPSNRWPKEFVVFSEEHAKELLSYFKELDSYDHLVIHCHAGMSRSPAVALTYAWYSQDSQLENTILNGKYTPNPHILSCMAKELGIAEIKKDIILKYTDDEELCVDFD